MDTFIELPAFERHRSSYVNDEGFQQLQVELLEDPCRGDVIAGTGGLRKMRFSDARRGKGKRGGLRIIYFWFQRQEEIWLFAIYDKDEMDDLSAAQKKTLKHALERELEARQ
jgi:hypothetical protein